MPINKARLNSSVRICFPCCDDGAHSSGLSDRRYLSVQRACCRFRGQHYALSSPADHGLVGRWASNYPPELAPSTHHSAAHARRISRLAALNTAVRSVIEFVIFCRMGLAMNLVITLSSSGEIAGRSFSISIWCS